MSQPNYEATMTTTLSDEQIESALRGAGFLLITNKEVETARARAVLALADEQHRAEIERMQSNCDNAAVEIADLKDRISFMGDELAIEVNWRNKACDASDDALMRLIAALAEIDALRISDRIKGENCEALRADAEAYRLIRRGQHWSVIDGLGSILCGEDLDAAIAARGKE